VDLLITADICYYYYCYSKSKLHCESSEVLAGHRLSGNVGSEAYSLAQPCKYYRD